MMPKMAMGELSISANCLTMSKRIMTFQTLRTSTDTLRTLSRRYEDRLSIERWSNIFETMAGWIDLD